MALEFNDSNFESEVLQASVPVLVDFSATWCGPCRTLAPVIDELAGDYEGKAKVGKVDIDQAQETAAKFGIMSVPTVLIFQGGRPVDTLVGAQQKAAYQQKLDALL